MSDVSASAPLRIPSWLQKSPLWKHGPGRILWQYWCLHGSVRTLCDRIKDQLLDNVLDEKVRSHSISDAVYVEGDKAIYTGEANPVDFIVICSIRHRISFDCATYGRKNAIFYEWKEQAKILRTCKKLRRGLYMLPRPRVCRQSWSLEYRWLHLRYSGCRGISCPYWAIRKGYWRRERANQQRWCYLNGMKLIYQEIVWSWWQSGLNFEDCLVMMVYLAEIEVLYILCNHFYNLRLL